MVFIYNEQSKVAWITILLLHAFLLASSQSVDVEMGFSKPVAPKLRSNTVVEKKISTVVPPLVSLSNQPPPLTQMTQRSATDTVNTAPTPPAPTHLKPTNIRNDAQLLRSVQEITRVSFNTTKGIILMDVHMKWAPIGSSTFLSLIMAGFYDSAIFFRTISGFVSQFGLNSDPAVQTSYDISIQDDTEATGSTIQSNTIGTVSFASHGPNSRSTQVFINLRDNVQLDAMNFTPIASLTEDSLKVATMLYSEYGENPDQSKIRELGNTYLEQNFPLLDKIITAKILNM